MVKRRDDPMGQGRSNADRGNLAATLVLVMAWIAAPSAAQLNEPADELHTAPWFADERIKTDPNPRRNGHGGGFVAKARRNAGDDGWETVAYSFTCGNRTTSLNLSPDLSGEVAAIVDCDEDVEYGAVDLRLHNVQDGGWYWVFRRVGDDVAAAAAPLIRMDLLARGAKLLPLEPSAGAIDSTVYPVEVDEDGRGVGGATVFTDEGNRLFDVFPHPRPLPGCYGILGDSDSRDAECGVGRPADWRLTIEDGDGQSLSGPIVRPAADAAKKEVHVTLSIETGHLVEEKCERRIAEIALTGGEDGGVSLALPDNVTLSTAGAEPEACPATTLAFSWTVEVADDAARCAATNGDRTNPQTVRVSATALIDASPPLPADDLFAEFQVNCPEAAAAASGRDLVPGNPFPPVD